MQTYIYALVDPRDSRVRYVGKSDDPERRLGQHCQRITGGRLHGWLSKLTQMNLRPCVMILDQVPEAEWPKYERAWIAAMRLKEGKLLTNVHPGGPLRGETMLGRKHLPETIEKMRTVALANRENRARAGRARKNRVPWCSGKKLPAEFGKKISEGRLRQYIRPWNKGLITPGRVKEKISTANRRTFSNPETRALLSKRTREYWASLSQRNDTNEGAPAVDVG